MDKMTTVLMIQSPSYSLFVYFQCFSLFFLFLHSPLFHHIYLFFFTSDLNCPTYTLHQTVMVSLEGLSKIVDPSQLTADFEGSLEYNHDDWIEVWMLCYYVTLSSVFGFNHLLCLIKKTTLFLSASLVF